MNQTNQELYIEYLNITQKAADLQYASAVLGWDQEVYMPSKGFSFRGRQLATLASLAHEWVTSDAYEAIIDKLNNCKDLSDEQQRNIILSKEDLEKNRKLTPAFIEEITKQTSNSYDAWIQARQKNDFSLYAPELEKMVQLKRQQAEMYGYTGHPYDALMDEYERGATTSLLDPIFKQVSEQLPALLGRIKDAPQVNDTFFNEYYPRQQQWDFSLKVLHVMGYDFDAGRQDMSEHPFTTSFAPTDVRITTRVNEHDLSSLLWSSIHEGGHALYEQGLPENQYGLPLGAATSLSIHESQSRLWENCVGRGEQFWKHFYPVLQSVFPENLKEIAPLTFYKGMNKVAPSLIRTEADEVTYHFHVMIRYEIEKQLIAGLVEVKDLKDLWNDMYHQYLGVSPTDDKTGILQDVHWCHGSFGYFPTYSLGSFYAAQFYAQAQIEIPGLTTHIAMGDCSILLKWLREKVHIHGRRYRSEELCQRITGKGLDFSVFMNYVTDKYTFIYDLK
jgi:carboxypeptidase Taq